MNDTGPVYHLRSFEDLVYDAVNLLYLAHDIDPANDKDGREFTYIRTSVLSTLLLFECGANCCVDALSLPGVFEKDVDKLPFVSKYEFFLKRISPATKFDRGCKEVQAIAELKTVRDDYVHPKVRKKSYSKTDACEADLGETKILKIPRDQRQWRKSHAVTALKSANDFFNLFFLSWCKFSADTVCEILLGSDPAAIPATSGTFVDAIGGLDRAVLDYGIDFRFIGKT